MAGMIPSELEGSRQSHKRGDGGSHLSVLKELPSAWTTSSTDQEEPLFSSSVSTFVPLPFSVEQKPFMLFVLLYVYFYLV